MIAYACNSSTLEAEAEAGVCEYKVNLSYKMSTMLARATWGNPISKHQKIKPDIPTTSL